MLTNFIHTSKDHLKTQIININNLFTFPPINQSVSISDLNIFKEKYYLNE